MLPRMDPPCPRPVNPPWRTTMKRSRRRAPSPGLKHPPPAPQGDETSSTISIKPDPICNVVVGVKDEMLDVKPQQPPPPLAQHRNQGRDGNQRHQGLAGDQSSAGKPPPAARSAAAQLKGDETGSISVKSDPVVSSISGYLLVAKDEQKVGVNQHVPQNPPLPPPPPAQNQTQGGVQQHHKPSDKANPPKWKGAKTNYCEDVLGSRSP